MVDRTELQLNSLLEKLERRSPDRHLLQPEFHAVLTRMRAEGRPVAARLDALDRRLVDEAVEAQFDNLPV